jgi:hypothetical protein
MEDKPCGPSVEEERKKGAPQSPPPSLPNKKEASKSAPAPKDQAQSPTSEVQPPTRWHRFWQWFCRMTVAEAVMAFLTLVIAGTGIVGICLVIQSSADTKAIVAATQEQACSARKIAEASQRNATAAEGFATSAGLINSGVQDAVKKLDAQAKATQESANAAQRSANVAEDTLIASNRPWLDIQPQIAGAFTLNEQGEARFILRVDTENIGHSPAIRAVSAQSVIQNILFTPNPWQELKKTCEQATGASANGNNRGLTETIFPGKPHQEAVNLGIGPKELARSVADMFPEAKPEPYIRPVVLWCVAYRADFSDTEYQTGYVWELMRKGPDGIVPIERNSNVPMNELVIQQVWPLGVLAN